MRSDKGFSQESFADHIGVHRTFMGFVERGESNLSFENILKVAEGLNITLSELFDGLEEDAKSARAGERGQKAQRALKPAKRTR